jgi:glycosyltransferase involved in cell wall biosynthesis
MTTQPAAQVGQVVVSDAGFLPTTRQMALAVSERLEAYFTPYWTGSLATRFLTVPGIGRELARRSIPAHLSAAARSFEAGSEIVRVLLGRAGIHGLDRRLIWHRNVAFDRKVAATLDSSTTLIGQYCASLASFERIRRLGGKRILDYPIARLDFTYELLAEEARLRPLFADTIFGSHALTPEPEHLRRVAAEVDLADAIVVGSRFAAESFRGVVEPERIVVAPYGVDTAAFRATSREDHRGPLRVLFAGQLTQRKGIAYLLEATRLLDPAAVELVLVGPVVGSGEGLRAYEARFRHRSGIPPHEMPEVYQQADVLVLPSLVEGSAVVVLEAIASGLPVIVTPNVGAEAVTDGVEGFIVPVRSAEAIAERLDLLASDLELRGRMGRAAVARSAGLDWSVFHKTIRQLTVASDDGIASRQHFAGVVP